MKKNYNLFKGFLVFAVFFTLSFGAKSQMSGTYSVGSVTANFLTLRQACDSLTILGVNGAVVLDIEDGTYTDTLRLDSVYGVSATNTITFQSLTANNTNVTIQGGDTVFAIGINHVIFKDLTINATANNEAIFFTGTEGLTIDKCNLSSVNDYAIQGRNYSNSPLSEIKNISITNSNITGFKGIAFDADNVSYVTIDNVDITSLGNAISLYGDYKANDITISNSDIVSTSSSAIYIQGYNTYVKNVSISNTNIESRYNGINIYSDLSVDDVNVENSNLKGQYPSYSSTMIDIEGYANNTSNVIFNNITIDSAYNGIQLYSDYLVKDVSATNLTINVYYNGFEIRGYSGGVENFSLNNSNIMTDNFYGIYVYSNDNLKNLTINNDSVVSKGRDAIYVNGLDIDNVNIDNLYAKGDTTSTSDEGFYIYANGNLTNLDITNSHIIGGRGIYINGYQTFENILIDNVIAHGKYSSGSSSSGQGLFLEASYGFGENLEITNSTFLSDTGYAAKIEGDVASLNQIVIDNSTFEGYRYALELETYSGMSNVYITNSSFIAKESSSSSSYTYALNMYNETSIMKDITIDSCTFDAAYRGILTEGYYNLGMENITIQNSEINLKGNSDPYGVYAYSDTKIKGYRVTNNKINVKTTGTSGYGVYVGGYGGTSKAIINNNDIKVDGTNGYGVYVEYLKDSNKVAFNDIDTNGSNYIHTGIYLNGDYSTTNGILVEGNTIPNSRYGIYGDYITGVEVLNNTILNTYLPSGYGIYLKDIKPGKFNVSGNEYLNYGSYYGLYFENIRLDSTQKGLVSNNFFANIAYGMYLENTKNVVFANNSFTTFQNNDLIELSSFNEKLEFYNNIFQVDSANYSSNIFDLDNITQIEGMDNNVTNIDTADANYVYDDFNNLAYKHMTDWNAYSGFDANSFIVQVDFVNDSLDLHALCSNTSLVAGMPLANVTTDIDGNVRAAIPTIGADEVLITGNTIFATDTLYYIAYPSVVLDAGVTTGTNTYSWNTGATSQTITVIANGWYRVTLTDACGAYTDSVYVLVNGTTSVDENENTLNVSIYPNPSNGEFTIATNDLASDKVSVSILTVAGQLVYNEVYSTSSTSQKQININNQPKGVYFVQIIANDIKTIKRIIKQ
jgi:hypothetical protein